MKKNLYLILSVAAVSFSFNSFAQGELGKLAPDVAQCTPIYKDNRNTKFVGAERTFVENKIGGKGYYRVDCHYIEESTITEKKYSIDIEPKYYNCYFPARPLGFRFCDISAKECKIDCFVKE